MRQNWTYATKIATGFAVLVVLAVLVAASSMYSLDHVVREKDRVIHSEAHSLVMAERLRAQIHARAAEIRGYIISRDAAALAQVEVEQQRVDELLQKLAQDPSGSPELTTSLSRIRSAEQSYREGWLELGKQVSGATTLETLANAWRMQLRGRFQTLENALDDYSAVQRRQLTAAQERASEAERFSTTLVSTVTGAAVVLSVLLAALLIRTLTRQIGSAVQQLQSSSTELQVSARQQATSAQEQATATHQISTTMRELLTTSRQIAENSQRVTRISDDTVGAAQGGTLTVDKAQDGLQSIKRQVDMVVSSMLNLGQKTQQIGAILELINELSEQTNILSINATIEAAGAGESGRRFAVVAEEIRKLADRVGLSTRDIRSMIDEVRAAANATTMATEESVKAVDSGMSQFREVAHSFRQIADRVANSSEAAREIELSTRQQTTAVEQVNVAIANVTQSAMEAEASARQTLDTASQLRDLASSLGLLVGVEKTGRAV